MNSSEASRTAMDDQGSEKPSSLSLSGSQGAARSDPEILYAKRKESTWGYSLLDHTSKKWSWIPFRGNEQKSFYPRF